MKCAVIDIGSNSVRLMLFDGSTVSKSICTTRLGEGLEKTRLIKQTNLQQTVKAVLDYRSESKARGYDNLFVFATETARSASNSAEFLRELSNEGIEVDILSGADEARIGYMGACGGHIGINGVIDIGGASTEVCVGVGEELVFSLSQPIGARRILDVCGYDRAKMDEYFAPFLGRYVFNKQVDNMYAIGGTATTIASCLQELTVYDSEKTNGYKVELTALKAFNDKLFALTVGEIAQLKGMYKARADVITCGAYLLECIMRVNGLRNITVSESDNLEGYIYLKLKGAGNNA